MARLTTQQGIDTEPNVRRTGSGSSSLLTAAAARRSIACRASGGQAQRLTFDGTYNVSPRHSPDGKKFHVSSSAAAVAFQRRHAGFCTRQVQVVDRWRRRRITELRTQRTHDPLRKRGKGPWYISRRVERWAVRSSGFSETGGDVREPAWGPLINR